MHIEYHSFYFGPIILPVVSGWVRKVGHSGEYVVKHTVRSRKSIQLLRQTTFHARTIKIETGREKDIKGSDSPPPPNGLLPLVADHR